MATADLFNESEEFQAEKAEIKVMQKDSWDKLKILGSLLIPIVVAFVGCAISVSINKSEGRANRDAMAAAGIIAAGNLSVAKENARVEQSKLVNNLTVHLSSDNAKEQVIAVFALRHAVPDVAESMLEAIKASKLSDDAITAAVSELAKSRDGEECESANECFSNYCYPAPSVEKKYCIDREMQCAFPNTSGYLYGSVVSWNKMNYECYQPDTGPGSWRVKKSVPGAS